MLGILDKLTGKKLGRKMDADYIAAYVGAFALTFTVIQGFFSWRAAVRQRDSDLTRWGGDVIDLMAEVETACHPLAPDDLLDHMAVERLSHKASALVDKGRLFFPKVKERGSKDKETRVKLLDEVLRTCYVARDLAFRGRPRDGKKLRNQVWQSRRRFVSLLQDEMKGSLKKVGKKDKGDYVGKNPRDWDEVSRNLRLTGE